METATGTRFGPYEILAPLGAGSMGEVYRAKDARLHREVALKILGADATGDPQREWRFLQEARAASALNHPNILAIFDVGSEETQRYIVSELIDGESLRDLLKRGAIPIRKFLDIAIQIADGLAAAHEAGIVHRDLKPENIMITKDGRVKLLDFGLAKTLIPLKGSAQEDTHSAFLTGRGVILGTMAYMSPEQARGKDIDFRSDQFSFGSILYEMATGTKAFHKETAVQTLTAILSEDPVSISILNPKFPALFRWLIERCLAKDARDRYASTVDLHHELRNFRDHLSEASFPTEPVEPVRPALRFKRKALVASGLLAIGLMMVSFILGIELVPPAPVDFSSFHFTPVATKDGLEMSPVWSPDGKSIAYSAEVNGVMQIFIRTLSEPSAIQITNSASDCLNPIWSSDGTRVFYSSREGKDWRAMSFWSVGATGGEPELVMNNAHHAAISTDGKTMFVFKGEPGVDNACALWVSSPPGAEPRRYDKEPFASNVYMPGEIQFSPDGTKVFASISTMDEKDYQRWLIPFPEGEPKRILPNAIGSGFRWMPDNIHMVYSSKNKEELDGSHLVVVNVENGQSYPLTMGLSDEMDPAVSPDGKQIAFASVASQYDLIEVPLDGSSIRNLLSTERDSELGPTWSPDGKQLVYASNRTGSYVLWMRSQQEGWERALVKSEDFGNELTTVLSRPSYSPDGKRIAYHRGTPGGSGVWISNMAGGQPVRLNSEPGYQFCPTWSPDSNWIAYLSAFEGRMSLVKARIGSPDPARIIQESLIYYQPQWSPRGDWISYQTSDGLFLTDPNGEKTLHVSKKSWLANGWTKDGSLLYGVRQDDRRHLIVASIDIQTGAEMLISDLGPSPFLAEGGASLVGFSMAPDERSFATSIWKIKGDLWLLNGFELPAGNLARAFQ